MLCMRGTQHGDKKMKTNNTLMDAVETALGDLNKLGYTENGALGYKTTGCALLDLNFRVASFRSAPEEEIVNCFMKAYEEEKLLAIKWLFFSRDIRGGLGERRLFRTVLRHLAEEQPELVKKLLPLVAEYGRFDDLLLLLKTACSEEVVFLIRMQVEADAKNMQKEKPISLLGKWLPSINTSSRETQQLGRRIAAGLGLTERDYRKMLSRFRKYIDVVERKMSGKQWGEIEYPRVPSRAALLYKDAFTRHDGERYGSYIKSVLKGEAKINAATLFPQDIVHQYGGQSWGNALKPLMPEVEALWKNLPNTIPNEQRILVVRDGSGSMTCSIGKTSISALDCSTALAIYFAERMSGEFKDKFITFSHRPQLVDISACATLHDKLARVYREDDCSNTDIHAVFRLILKAAVDKKLTQADMPTSILILSDMEFDGHQFDWDRTLFESISAEYAAQGFKLPKLIFWNLNSRTKIVPLTQNEFGVILVSGFSPLLSKMVLSVQLDPFRALVEVLNSARYKPIEDVLN